MINTKTKLFVCDNSGATLTKCIQVYNKKIYANIGDIVKVSIKKKNPHKKIIKNKMYPAVVLTTKKNNYRKNGIFIKFTKNRILLCL